MRVFTKPFHGSYVHNMQELWFTTAISGAGSFLSHIPAFVGVIFSPWLPLLQMCISCNPKYILHVSENPLEDRLQYVRLCGHELRASYQPLCPRVLKQARSHPAATLLSLLASFSKPPLLLNEFKRRPCWRNVHARRAMRQKFLRAAAAVSLQLVWTEITT